MIFSYASIFGIYKCDSDFEVDQAAAMWPFANLLVNLRYFIRSIALFFSVFFSFPSPSSFPHVSSVPLFLCVCVCVCELMIFQTFSGWVKRAVLETSAAFLSPGRYSSSGRRHSFHAQSFGLTMASNRNGNRCHSLPPPPPRLLTDFASFGVRRTQFQSSAFVWIGNQVYIITFTCIVAIYWSRFEKSITGSLNQLRASFVKWLETSWLELSLDFGTFVRIEILSAPAAVIAKCLISKHRLGLDVWPWLITLHFPFQSFW